MANMRQPSRSDVLLGVSIVLIAGAALGYLGLLGSGLFSSSSTPRAAARASPELKSARRDFRENFSEVRAHIRLAEALYRSQRSVDAFYVLLAARRQFPGPAFLQAQETVVLGKTEKGEAAVKKAAAAVGSDPLQA